MRFAGNLQSDQRIFVAIFPLDGLLGGRAGFGQEGFVAGKILENNVAVVGWVDIFFHKPGQKNGSQRYKILLIGVNIFYKILLMSWSTLIPSASAL